MAVENIVIDFDVDISKLLPVIELLEKTGQVDSKLRATFEANNIAFKERQAAMAQLATATGAGTTGVDNLNKAVGDLGKTVSGGAIKEFSNEISGTVTKFKSVTSELNNVKASLKQMVVDGKAGTKQFEELVKRAGQLQQATKDVKKEIADLGRGTTVKGLVEGIKAYTAASGIAAGVTGLFGTENKELEKQLLRVQSIMAILNGITELQNILRRGSALYTLGQTAAESLGVTAKTAAVVATEAVVVAETEQVVATEAATVATAELNATMLLNPAVLVLASVAALGLGVYALVKYFNSASEADKEYDHQLSINVETMKSMVEWNKKLSDSRLHQMQNDGATEEQLITQKLENARKEQLTQQKIHDDLSAKLDKTKEDYEAIAEARKNAFGLTFTINDLISDLTKAKHDAGLKADKDAEDSNKKQLADYEKFLDDELNAIKKRNADPAYQRANFSPVTETGGNPVIEDHRKAQQKMMDESMSDLELIVDADAEAKQAQIDADKKWADTVKKDQDEVTKKTEEEAKKRLKAITDNIQAGLQFAAQAVNIISGLEQNANERETQAIEAKYERKKKEGKLSVEDQKKFDKEMSALKTKQAKEDKILAEINVAIHTAENVVKAFPNPILIAAAIALGIGEAAVIAGKPIPQFAKGTDNAPAGFKWVGEKGPELIYDKGGYPIFSNPDSMKLMENYGFANAYPAMNMSNEIPEFSFGGSIDYDKMADAIANKMGANFKNLKQVHINVNEKGFQTRVQQGNSTQIILDNRYKG